MLARLKIRFAILAISFAVSVGGFGGAVLAATNTQRCAPITSKRVAALFDRWNASLAKSPDAAVANYAADAVLLPTKANGPLIGHTAIRGYFVHFLESHPSAVIVTRTIMIACNMAFDAGLYDFKVDGSTPGSRTVLKARYTFVYAPRRGRWLIVQHHSSVLPVPGP